MKNYLFDTNILLYYLRQDVIWENIQTLINFRNTTNAISVTSIGELWSIAIRNKWGDRRLNELEKISNQFTILDINFENVIKKYGEIDAYSQGKITSKPLGHSARNMGKNDLWIAATASIFNLVLVSTDLDFTHLDKVYLDLELVDIQKMI